MAALLGVLFAAAAATAPMSRLCSDCGPGWRDSQRAGGDERDAAPAHGRYSASSVWRTIVAPVSVAWLGVHVLYLEEFSREIPRIAPPAAARARAAGTPAHAVRVRLFTFARPRHGASQLTARADGETRVARPWLPPRL